jgi:hypothetical protein
VPLPSRRRPHSQLPTVRIAEGNERSLDLGTGHFLRLHVEEVVFWPADERQCFILRDDLGQHSAMIVVLLSFNRGNGGLYRKRSGRDDTDPSGLPRAGLPPNHDLDVLVERRQ